MTTTSIPNLHSVLTNFAADGLEAEEILFCTFNQQLPFFERQLLGPCRATGARVTVIGDQRLAQHDVVGVQHAGATYLAANAKSNRSFHAKLFAICSTERAIVAVGSGNLTVSGWWGNDELWTIYYADGAGASPVVAAVGEWCADLPNKVRLSDDAISALNRVAKQLVAFQDSTVVCDAQLTHNLEQPIIDQLPAGPVDQLNLYAPFLDNNAEAIAKLFERFQPAIVHLGFQPEMTSANGMALRSVLGAHAESGNTVQVFELDDEPYRHGKLIEWRVGETWTVLTGSPNLSSPALLHPAGPQGNVELATIVPNAVSQMPEGALQKIEAVHVLKRRGPATRRAEEMLLFAATRRNGNLHVEFTSALKHDAKLHIAYPTTQPGAHDYVVDVEAGRSEFDTNDAPGRSRVWLLHGDNISNTTFVVDPELILRTAGRSSGKTVQAPELADIFSDLDAAKLWIKLLEQMPKRYTKPMVAAPSVSNAASGSEPDRYTVGDWRDYLHQAEQVLSPALVAFAYGIKPPSPGQSHSSIVVPVNWDDDEIDDIAGGLDEDDLENDDESFKTTAIWTIAEETRAKFWKAIVGAFGKDDVDMTEHLSLIRALLVFVAAGGASSIESSWTSVVYEQLGRLVDSFDDDDACSAASLAAVALACTATELAWTNPTPAHRQQRRVQRQLAPLIEHADNPTIEEYCTNLRAHFGSSVSPASVVGLVDRIVDFDPLIDAVHDMRVAGFIVSKAGALVRCSAPSSPQFIALQLLSFCAEVETCMIRVDGESKVSELWKHGDKLVVKNWNDKGVEWGIVYRARRQDVEQLREGNLEVVSSQEVERYNAGQPITAKASEIVACVNELL